MRRVLGSQDNSPQNMTTPAVNPGSSSNQRHQQSVWTQVQPARLATLLCMAHTTTSKPCMSGVRSLQMVLCCVSCPRAVLTLPVGLRVVHLCCESNCTSGVLWIQAGCGQSNAECWWYSTPHAVLPVTCMLPGYSHNHFRRLLKCLWQMVAAAHHLPGLHWLAISSASCWCLSAASASCRHQVT